MSLGDELSAHAAKAHPMRLYRLPNDLSSSLRMAMLDPDGLEMITRSNQQPSMVSIIPSQLASRVSLDEAFGEVAQQTSRDLVEVGSQRLVVNQLEQANPWLVSQAHEAFVHNTPTSTQHPEGQATGSSSARVRWEVLPEGWSPHLLEADEELLLVHQIGQVEQSV
jgi:hypothetical protein